MLVEYHKTNPVANLTITYQTILHNHNNKFHNLDKKEIFREKFWNSLLKIKTSCSFHKYFR